MNGVWPTDTSTVHGPRNPAEPGNCTGDGLKPVLAIW